MTEKQEASSGPKAFTRRDALRSIELRIQAKWKAAKVYETQAAFDEAGNPLPKFMATFPYPYMNGRLHLGHAYSMTKAEFATRFQRLLGKNALFPFGFHCTGMPIQASANKLKAELEAYGCPPQFPAETDEGPQKEKQQPQSAEAIIQAKSKGKKSKTITKQGSGVVRQWDIMKMMLDESEIPEFVDPIKWLKYFPPLGKVDLQKFGTCTDWRRSFITTSVNSYYDSFIRWQFRVLKEHGRVRFGKRPNVYSALDGQVCADHDRASGETVGPQEYTIVKLRVLEPYPVGSKLEALAGRQVFLGPATLRPETMYGQTNCYVLPDGHYGAYELANGDVLIISARAAKGLAHQDYTSVWGEVKELVKLTGWDILGLPLSAPNCPYERIYTLPLLTISMGKGTGVVTSVPSDAPDDYVALKELQDKPDYRAKFKLTDEMVMPYEVVPIIDIPGYGDKAAVVLCEKLKIKSPKEAEKLKEAKDEVYLKGFCEGVMLVGSCKGMKVAVAKPIIKQELINRGDALTYYEPESTVMSRSGDECVVALTDQWYLAYGEEDWRDRVDKHIHSEAFTAFSSRVLEAFEDKVAWLREWACSRQFGLGTKLPWDEQWVIESLSDSTIYMAYYTIAHMLHGEDNLNGSGASPAGIRPEQLTDEVWTYIFLRGPLPSSSDIPVPTLEAMRREFEYWYPMDLRVSAKDLIPNHLTMALYNHTEVWRDRPELWPRGFFCNGHILVDAEKMSKSKGNFLMMDQCVEEFTADATRLALADAGDLLDDANFSRDTVNAAILQLYIEEEWVRTVLQEKKEGKLRGSHDDVSAAAQYMDQAFENKVTRLVQGTCEHFTKMAFRDGLQSCWYGMMIARDQYRDWAKVTGHTMREDLLMSFIETLVVIASPICPHWCEHLWELLGKPGFVVNARWPQPSKPYDTILGRSYEFLQGSVRLFRLAVMKSKKGEKKAYAYIADRYTEWQTGILLCMQQALKDNGGQALPANIMEVLKEKVMGDAVMKPFMKESLKFGAHVRDDFKERGVEALELTLPYDQKAILLDNLEFVRKTVGLEELDIFNLSEPDVPGPENKKKGALPGKPDIALY